MQSNPLQRKTVIRPVLPAQGFYDLIGRIQNVRINARGDPLIYAARQYRALLPSDRVKPDGVG